MQPAVILDFGFQLSRRPAGITERENGVLRPGAVRDRLEDIDGCGQANSVVDLERRILDKEIAECRPEPPTVPTRPPFHPFLVPAVFRQLVRAALLDIAACTR